MGYGEFDGGGSVDWKIEQTDGDSGEGGKHGGHGKDKDPKQNGFFLVRVSEEGKAPREMSAPCVKGTKISVNWFALPSQASGPRGIGKIGTPGKKK